MQGSYCHMNYLLAFKGFNELGFAHMGIGPMAKTKVITFSPKSRTNIIAGLVNNVDENVKLHTHTCYSNLLTYQVQTCPDFVRARENWAPHSI